MNQRKAGAVLSYLQIILTNTVSLLYTPYMLRMMGQTEYGIYGTAGSFAAYLTVLNFGISGAYIRFHARKKACGDEEGERQLNGMFFIIFACLSGLVLLGGAGIIALAGKLVENTYTAQDLWKLRMIIAILTVNTVTSFLFNVVMMALHAYEKYVVVRTVLIICGIATPVLNIIALHNGGRSVTITLISYLLGFAAYLFFLFYARKAIRLRFSFRGLHWGEMKEVFAFSGFLFLNSITDQITFSTDSVILSAVHGPAIAAVYTVGSQFKTYFQQFSSSVSGVFSPQINRIVASQENMQELNGIFTRVGRLQFYVVSLIMIGYLSIGQAFIRLWAGEGYEAAFFVGLLLMVSVFVPSIQNVGVEIQQAKNMHKARSVVYFLIALINVLLTIPFCIWWGPVGAALATMICMFFGTVVFMNFYYAKYIHLDIRGFWKSISRILPGYLIPVGIGTVIRFCWQVNSLLECVLAALIITAGFAGSVWCFSMNDYEKDLIRKPLQRLRKRKYADK